MTTSLSYACHCGARFLLLQDPARGLLPMPPVFICYRCGCYCGPANGPLPRNYRVCKGAPVQLRIQEN